MRSYNYKVYEVGSALFSTYNLLIGEALEEQSIFDFGCADSELFNRIANTEYQDSKTLVISHFHLDHYKGLANIDDHTLSIKKLIIPKLPTQESLFEGMKAFLGLQIFYLGEITGYYETDLLKIIRRKNTTRFNIERKERGDNFEASGDYFDVLWPEKDYLKASTAIDNALNKINSVIEENEAFGDFFRKALESEIFDNDYTLHEGEEEVTNKKIEISKEQRELLQSANRTLINLANVICLAFHNRERKLLSLGDLSDKALDKLFILDFNEKVKYDVILSAHHGTHSSLEPKWNNIKSCVVVNSNGSNMIRGFRGAYCCWSHFQHHTFYKGMFNSQVIQRLYKINEIIRNKK